MSRDDLARGSCSFCNAALTIAFQQPQASVASAVDDDPAAYQADLAANRNARVTVAGVLWRLALFTVVAGNLWFGIVCGALDGDPWLGGHAAIFCPRVCASCHGPYVYFSWTTSTTSPSGNRRDTTEKVYCRNAVVPIEQMSWMERMNARAANESFELRGGMWNIWGSSMLLWLGLGFPLSFAWAGATARHRRRNAEALAQNMVRVRRLLRSKYGSGGAHRG